MENATTVILPVTGYIATLYLEVPVIQTKEIIKTESL
jgi:hypothetical protein